jgi:peptide/nickel transport system substrate-binding protein
VTLLHGVLFGQSAPVPMLPDYGIAPVAPPSVYTSPALHNDPYPYSIPAAESLLRAHGWAKNSSGVDVCQRPGTASNACGAGIAKGQTLSLLFMYSTEAPYFLAQVEAFVAAAKQAGRRHHPQRSDHHDDVLDRGRSG